MPIECGSPRHARLTRPRQISHGALRGHSWADNDDMAGSLFESGARTEALQLVIVAVAGADATGVIALDQSCLVTPSQYTKFFRSDWAGGQAAVAKAREAAFRGSERLTAARHSASKRAHGVSDRSVTENS